MSNGKIIAIPYQTKRYNSLFLTFGAFCAAAANACELPVGTGSAESACGNGEVGCAVSVLQAATELSCTSGYYGSPAKANAVCGTNGEAFTLSTGDFCAACSVANCDVCASDTCTECASTFILDADAGSCAKTCPAGEYGVADTDAQCTGTTCICL